MKKLFVFMAFFLSLGLYCDETKINIEGIGVLYIPDRLEVQAGRYKKFNDIAKEKVFNLTERPDRVVIQQAGLNSHDENALKTYCRMTIQTEIGNRGDFNILNSKIEATKDELQTISDLFKTKTQETFDQKKSTTFNQKLIKWNGAKIKKVNSYYALCISYVRQLNNNPYVFVEHYTIENNDRMHTIIISYRVNETERWEKIFDKVLHSLTLIER